MKLLLAVLIVLFFIEFFGFWPAYYRSNDERWVGFYSERARLFTGLHFMPGKVFFERRTPKSGLTFPLTNNTHD